MTRPDADGQKQFHFGLSVSENMSRVVPAPINPGLPPCRYLVNKCTFDDIKAINRWHSLSETTTDSLAINNGSQALAT